MITIYGSFCQRHEADQQLAFDILTRDLRKRLWDKWKIKPQDVFVQVMGMTLRISIPGHGVDSEGHGKVHADIFIGAYNILPQNRPWKKRTARKVAEMIRERCEICLSCDKCQEKKLSLCEVYFPKGVMGRSLSPIPAAR